MAGRRWATGPVAAVTGIGPRTAAKLGELGITTVRELATADVDAVRARFGPRMGAYYVLIGRGTGSDVVSAEPWVRRSLSHQTTFPTDLLGRDEVEPALVALADRVSAGVAEDGRSATHVGDRRALRPVLHRSRGCKKLAEPTQDAGALRDAAVALLDRVDLTRRIRLLGVRADLEPPPTPSVSAPTEHREPGVRGRPGSSFCARRRRGEKRHCGQSVLVAAAQASLPASPSSPDGCTRPGVSYRHFWGGLGATRALWFEDHRCCGEGRRRSGGSTARERNFVDQTSTVELLVGQVPAPPLDRFIDDIYCLTGVPRHRRMNVPPMPSAHLFVNLGGPVRLWDSDPSVPPAVFTDGWFMGVWTRRFLFEYPTRVRLVGVHFKPWGISPFVDMPATELRDRWVPVDAVWQRSLDRIRNQVGDIASATETLRVLEAELRSRLPRHRRAVSTWSSTQAGVWRLPTARSRSVR